VLGRNRRQVRGGAGGRTQAGAAGRNQNKRRRRCRNGRTRQCSTANGAERDKRRRQNQAGNERKKPRIQASRTHPTAGRQCTGRQERQEVNGRKRNGRTAGGGGRNGSV